MHAVFLLNRPPFHLSLQFMLQKLARLHSISRVARILTNIDRFVLTMFDHTGVLNHLHV